MDGETKQANAATMALVYVAVGALMSVWTAIYFFFASGLETSGNTKFWPTGFFFSGLVLIGTGLFVSRISRAALEAEVTSLPTQAIAPNATVAATPQQQGPTDNIGTVSPGKTSAAYPTTHVTN